MSKSTISTFQLFEMFPDAEAPSFARMHFMRGQFRCASCGGATSFEPEFIAQYVAAQAALPESSKGRADGTA